MDPEPWPDELLRLLVAQAGLRLAPEDMGRIERMVRESSARRFPSLAAWRASLSPHKLARELERLAGNLTPAETFFFRDHGQFDLLRFHLLPELIARRRSQRTLRLWSAGCATGEEAYSLAMLVDILIPDRDTWRIDITGSDINADSLAKARRGRYGRWSLRTAPESLMARYFRQAGDEWLVNDDIRRMVSFRTGNLVQDPAPQEDMQGMDVILCRNVLIYFHADAVRAVADKLAACLADGGYLITGHTELIGHRPPGLRSRLFPEGVVYQRCAESPPVPAASAPAPARPRHDRPSPPPRRRPPDMPRGRLPGDPAPAAAPAPADNAASRARMLADRGEYAAAEAACREALESTPLAPEPHFLLAQLAQLRGDHAEAERQLKRTLYLAPDFVAAYLELAALHERAGDAERAARRRRAALEILRGLPADQVVAPFEAGAGELADWLMQTEALR